MKLNGKFLSLVAIAGLSVCSNATLVFLPDANINAIRKFNAEDGAYKGLLGTGFFNNSCYACAVNPVDGFLYVAVYDSTAAAPNNGTIMKFDPFTGAYAGQIGNGFLQNPIAIDFTADGTMYVSDAATTPQIFRFNPTTGAYLGTLGSGFVSGWGGLQPIAIGSDGNLYASANGGAALARLNPTTGAFLGLVGNTFFANASSITKDNSGKLFVGQYSTVGSQMRFRESDGAYLGIFANGGFVPGVSGSGVLPNGQVLVRGESSGTQYVARFEPETGAYKGLFAANYGMSGFGLGVEQPVTITGSVNLDEELGGGSFPVVVELRNPDGSLAEPGITVNLVDNGSFTYKTFLKGDYLLSVKPSHWLRKGSSTFTLTRTGPAALTFFCLNGDIDGDNEIGPGDFDAVVAEFGNVAPTIGDIDGDGECGPSDFDYIVAKFGSAGDF